MKHTMKHTKGPWVVRKSEPWVIAKDYGNQKSVVHLNISSAPSERDLANARLIAAAPELLDALIVAKQLMDMDMDGWGTEAALEQARAAIKKALGVDDGS